jgi:hypothetical protein
MPEYKMKKVQVHGTDEKDFSPREAYEFLLEHNVVNFSYPAWIEYLARLVMEKPAIEFRMNVIYHPRHLTNGDSEKQYLMIVKIQTKEIANEVHRMDKDGSFDELYLSTPQMPEIEDKS